MGALYCKDKGLRYVQRKVSAIQGAKVAHAAPHPNNCTYDEGLFTDPIHPLLRLHLIGLHPDC